MVKTQTVSGAAQELRDSTLKTIVGMLLTESKHRPQSSVEALARIHTRDAGFNSVGRILKEMNASQEVVDFAIKICLQRTKKEHPVLGGGAALSCACKWIVYSVSEEIKNKVIMEVARQGMYNQIEGLTRKHLSRDLTEKEARLLIKTCLEDRMTNSTHDVGEHLLTIAKRCLPEDEAEKIEEQIRELERNFDLGLD